MKRWLVSVVVACSLAMAIPALSATTPKKCCRTCVKGKACGNGCINKKSSCKKPKGCACDKDKNEEKKKS